ncbi:MAG: DHH family phosphoesterase [FCB group bacterium]|nr:DHH family phosphoesterase [FCB group bacterium]MBL7027621.1 DHH family phosphoesterase [Candidatus Neomarinimicrobiota bacterium]MBL7121251.1 DHH family phosphoesterase [Candidatus Neomarinimicrobiota bacterium]
MSVDRTGELRNWEVLRTLLVDNDKFVFSTHLQPDADGVGSELALARYLTSIGKTVHILNPSPLRVNLEFLPTNDEILVYDKAQHAKLVGDSDIFIAFDIGHYDRLMDLGKDLQSIDITKVSIDHHPGDKSQFDIQYDFPTASSTGVLIYDLINSMDEEANSRTEIAIPIYSAMMSDTGNFRFNNTDPETLLAAAHLVSVGVKPYELYVYLYEDLNTPGRLQVIQKLLSELKYECDGRLAWSIIDFEDIRSLGATPDDMNSLSDFIRSIKGVEVGISITQISGQKVDVSFRSKGKIPINTVAQAFGGGGHAFAAGCHVDGTLEEAATSIVKKSIEVINSWDSNV